MIGNYTMSMFSNLIKQIKQSSFQAESKHSGDEFEDLVLQDLFRRGFTEIQPNVHMIGTGCEIDFIADSAEFVECKGGKTGGKKRPGAKRTDNVKKAIANACLIKTMYNNIYYVVYFSSEPVPKSYSEEMLHTALKFGIIDEVRYLEY